MHDNAPQDPSTYARARNEDHPTYWMEKCEELEADLELLRKAANHKPTAPVAPTGSHNDYEVGAALGRIIAWLVDARKLSRIGERALIAAYKVRPDLLNGMTLDDIAAMLGQGRSATHKLAKEFTTVFGMRGKNDKSAKSCKAYAAAFRRHVRAKIEQQALSKPSTTPTK